MSADRLRAAATAVADGTYAEPTEAIDAATATLLQAVADGHNEACFVVIPEDDVNCEEALAALALADAILGDTDE